MLIIVSKMPDVNIKVDGLMIRRPISEAETVEPFVVSNKLKLLACPIVKVMNLITGRSFHLKFRERKINKGDGSS